MRIGNVISHYRQKCGLKQKELAEKTGIKPSTLSKIENNKLYPPMKHLEEIGRSMGIPAQILVFLSLDESDVPEQKRDELITVFEDVEIFVEKFLLEKTLTKSLLKKKNSSGN